MNIEEIRNNAPKLATHYDEKTLEYYMLLERGAVTIPYLFQDGEYIQPYNIFLNLKPLH